ncbi:p-loop containing nucleoside triphosphate hydrolase protein [Mycena sanguinolenta]|uniref:p-loop containing nucleoside triphosphate hydrolase protein n=1 Tax=Mycena sanguinolenta TaxID=230812 RepID=A0A8H6YY03_9AGAR|nr:p-loop containing nucleoside triphosphate hydrolase protein [Mycena sanguinolenta]
MGAVLSALVPAATAVASLLLNIRSQPAGNNPTHDDIEAADMLRQEQEERDGAAQEARDEAERLACEAEMLAERAREAQAAQEAAQAAMEAAQAEAEHIKREAEESRLAAERAAEAERHEAQRREQEIKEAARREAEEVRTAAERAAETERHEAQRREQEIQGGGEESEEEKRRAAEAKLTAEEAARIAADEMRAAHEAKAELEHQLREGIQPVVMPSAADLEDAKRRIEYQDGLYHFAVAGVAGAGKSSLINALRGLRSKAAGAAATGITETTLSVGRFLDSDPKNPFVWYDIPGAGTLQVRDWQYFNKQGLYVFDALVVLIDNRFTMTDVAILRNARLFGIPCYIVRSKADIHIQNLMQEMVDESDDEEQDEQSLETREHAARKHFVAATRQNIRDNLRAADLPDQRVYIVSNLTMLNVTKSKVKTKTAEKIIDEFEFLQDLLEDAYKRRGGVAKAKSKKSSTAVVKSDATGGLLPQRVTSFFSSASAADSDRPQHPFLEALTRSPAGTLAWVCAGAVVLQGWWGGWVREWGIEWVLRGNLRNAWLATGAASFLLHVVLVLLGAPLLSHVWQTYLLALLLSILIVFPPAYTIGTPRDSLVAWLTWVRIFAEFSARCSTPPSGAWLGVIPIALDWDRPWQAYPLPPALGSLAGYILASIAALTASAINFFAEEHLRSVREAAAGAEEHSRSVAAGVGATAKGKGEGGKKVKSA